MKRYSKAPLYLGLIVFVLLNSVLLVSSFTASLTVQSAKAGTQSALTLKWSLDSGLPTSWDGSVVIGKILGDNRQVVVVGGNSAIVAVDGATGTILWTYRDSALYSYCQPQMFDIDGDGNLEVLAPLYYPAGILVLRGDGSLYWRKITGVDAYLAPTVMSGPVAGDVNGDGKMEVFLAEDDVGLPYTGKLTEFSYDGEIIAQTFVWRACSGGLSLADADNDGIYELYMGDRSMYYVEGSNYGKGVRSFWAVNLTERWNKLDIGASSQKPMLVDVDDDGILDVVATNQNGGVVVLDSRSGDTKKMFMPGKGQIGFSSHYQASIYDIDGDGHLEIMGCDGDHDLSSMYQQGVGNYNQTLVIFDLVSWKIDAILTPGNSKFGPQIADVTGDGKMDMIVANTTALLVYTFNGTGYSLVQQVTGLRGGLLYPVMQDIDNDDLNEVVVAASSGRIYTYDTLGLAPTPRARSEVQFYSERRLGVSEYVPPPGQEDQPIISSPNPTNGALNVSVQLSELSFSIFHRGGPVNYTVSTSPSFLGEPVSRFNVGNGTQSIGITGLQYDTDYIWQIDITDGQNYYSRNYTFATVISPTENWWLFPPTQSRPSLGMNGISIICTNQSTFDPDGGKVTNIFNWYRNNTSLTNLLLPFDTKSRASVEDYSGYGSSGTVHGASWTSNGVEGGAYVFDGADDYISVPDGGVGHFDGHIYPSTLSGDGTWQELTVEHWIYLTKNQRDTRTIAKMPGFEIGFSLNAAFNNVLYGGVFTSDLASNGSLMTRGQQQATWSSSPLKLNTWYHVVLTYRNDSRATGQNPSLRLYVNGVLVANNSHVSGVISPSSGEAVLIGKPDYFSGMIDDIRVYSHALSLQQVQERFYETKDGRSDHATMVLDENDGRNVWMCAVTPNDGRQDGETTFSNEFTVPSLHLYRVNFARTQFKDADGVDLYSAPSSFRLKFQNGTTSVPLSLGSYLIQGGVTTWSSIIWQGSEVSPGTSFDSSNGDPTVNCQVYSLRIKSIDPQNNLLNLNVTLTFPNMTSLTKSPSQGWINLTQVQTGTLTLISPGSISGSERYVLLNSTSIPLAADQVVDSLVWRHDYKVTIGFKDNSGIYVLSTPSGFSVLMQNGTTANNPPSNSWMPTGTTTLTSITWQGSKVLPQIAQAIAISSATTYYYNVRVYYVAFLSSQFKDSSGTTLYKSPTSFKITFPNSTVSTILNPDSSYLIQNGTTKWNSITWQGTNVAPLTSFDATNGNPSVNCQVYSLNVKNKDQPGNLLTRNIVLTFPNGTALTKTSVSGWINMTQLQTGTVSLETPITVSTNERYVLLNSSDITLTSDTTVNAAVWRHDFQVTIGFKDSSGTYILSNPSSFYITMQNGTYANTPSSNVWMPTGTVTLTSVTWQGSNVRPQTAPTTTIDSATTYYYNVRVYTTAFGSSQFKDSNGAVLYSPPSSFRLKFQNGTTSASLPLGSYLIQNGTTAWSSITWQGTDVTPSSSFNPENGSPNVNCRIYSLQVNPTFINSLNLTTISPDLWSLRFPNGTLTITSVKLIYSQVQCGNYTITSVLWKRVNVMSKTSLQTILASDTVWKPEVKCDLGGTDVSLAQRPYMIILIMGTLAASVFILLKKLPLHFLKEN